MKNDFLIITLISIAIGAALGLVINFMDGDNKSKGCLISNDLVRSAMIYCVGEDNPSVCAQNVLDKYCPKGKGE